MTKDNKKQGGKEMNILLIHPPNDNCPRIMGSRVSSISSSDGGKECVRALVTTSKFPYTYMQSKRKRMEEEPGSTRSDKDTSSYY